MSEQTLAASPAARAAVLSRSAPRPGGRLRLTAKALKITCVLDTAALEGVEVPPGSPPVAFVIDAGGRRVVGKLNAKSLRRAIVTIRENGADQVAAIVQGRLTADDVIEEAGLAAQIKGPRPL